MTTSFALLAIRIWWMLIAVLAVIGAVCGYVAVRDSPYQSTSTLRVDTAGYDEVSQKSIVETARILVDSNRTYGLIAGNDPAKIEALRQRTTVEVQLTSSILLVTVTDRSAAQAEHDVNALADTAIVNFQQLASQQFDKTVTSGQGALATGRLSDPVAEAARRQAVGQAIAAQQDTALRLSAELSRVGTVTPAVKVGLSGPIAALMGGLAGVFVGVCAALALGVGRRRIKRLADLETLAPTVARCEPIPMDGIARVAAEANRIMHPLVVVLALRGAEDALETVTESLRAEFNRDGTRAFPLGHDDVRHVLAADRAAARGDGPGVVARRGTTAQMAAPALGMPRRAADLAAAGADILLVTGRGDDHNLHHVASRADVTVLVCGWRQTRASAVIEATRQLPMEPLAYVVLTDPEARRGSLRALSSRSRASKQPSDRDVPGPGPGEPVPPTGHEPAAFVDQESPAPADDHETPAPADQTAQAPADQTTPVAADQEIPAEHEPLASADEEPPTDHDAPTPANHVPVVSLVHASRPTTPGEEPEAERAEIEERTPSITSSRPPRPRPTPWPRPSHHEMARSVTAGRRGEN